MLVLTRTDSEKTIITIPPSDKTQTIIVTTTVVSGNRTKLGFDAPKEINIRRAEIQPRDLEG